MPYRRIHKRPKLKKMGSLRNLDEDCVEKYQSHFPWLRDRKFLNDLESDSVDSEILEEELSALQDDEPVSVRQRIAKCLQSHPVQIILCVLVLLDAGIVIAQILLDLHYFREKHHSCEDDMTKLLRFTRETHLEELSAYHGSNIDTILNLLQPVQDSVRNSQGRSQGHISNSGISGQPFNNAAANMQRQTHNKGQSNHLNSKQNVNNKNKRTSIISTTSATLEASLRTRAGYNDGVRSPSEEDYYTDMDIVGDFNTQTTEQIGYINRKLKSILLKKAEYTKHNRKVYALRKLLSEKSYADTYGDTYEYANMDNDVQHMPQKQVSEHTIKDKHESDVLHDVAHYLHIASICILGFLVIEDVVKAIAMGREFFKHKVEVFDAIIIVSSFVVDLVFLGGMPGDEGEKAAAVLVVLLLWRIARVVDGIVITVKQKQEFRIRLQKRARRKAEKRIDNLEEERHYKTRQIQAIRELCHKSGILEEEIEACLPKKTKRTSSTASALTSVARLSVSMTMSMSSGLFSLVDDVTDKLEEFQPGKSPSSDIAFARWKRDSTQDDGISMDLGRPAKTTRGMSLPDFRQRGIGLTQSPAKKESFMLSTSPYSSKRDIILHSPGQKREMLYSSAQHQTIKEESPNTSVTTSPVNASGVAIVIDSGSDDESSCSSTSCDKESCDLVSIKSSDNKSCDYEIKKSCDPSSCDYVNDMKSCDPSLVTDYDNKTDKMNSTSEDPESDSFLSSDPSFEGDRRDSNQSQTFLLKNIERV